MLAYLFKENQQLLWLYLWQGLILGAGCVLQAIKSDRL